jgi:hypothetical protein
MKLEIEEVENWLSALMQDTIYSDEGYMRYKMSITLLFK